MMDHHPLPSDARPPFDPESPEVPGGERAALYGAFPHGRRGLPDLGRLRLLVELRRLGTMAEVAAATGYGTSAVSKHLAVLEQEVGAKLLAPVGRRVRLTPAGERLVEHAVTILAAVEEARAELRGESEPVGRVRVAGFVTAVEPLLLPAIRRLRERHPGVRVEVHEHEPEQSVALLRAGEVELALIYDYSLVPRTVPADLSVRRLEEQPLYLVVPAGDSAAPAPFEELNAYAEAGWITNSRGSDDDELVRRACALAGFEPHIAHRVDSLRLVNRLAGAGLGVAVLAEAGRLPDQEDVRYRRLDPLAGSRRSFLVVRTGQWSWPPIAALATALQDVLAAAAESA